MMFDNNRNVKNVTLKMSFREICLEIYHKMAGL